MSSAAVTGKTSAPELREVELSIRGMTCAACAVRVEKKLGEIPGVTACVNVATEKATMTAPLSVEIERLIRAVEQAGYSAESASPPEAGGLESADEAGDAARVAYLRRRLIVALAFFVPLSDLSVQVSLVPSVRFPG